jgi:hypothetical protein
MSLSNDIDTRTLLELHPLIDIGHVDEILKRLDLEIVDELDELGDLVDDVNLRD